MQKKDFETFLEPMYWTSNLKLDTELNIDSGTDFTIL